MAGRYLDEIIETLMITYHQMSFRSTAKDWRKHSVHMPMFRKSKHFHDNEYARRWDVDSANEIYLDGVASGERTDKNNIKRKTSVPRADYELKFIANPIGEARRRS